jgi:DNA-binding transcriptional ArsR family regulator
MCDLHTTVRVAQALADRTRVRLLSALREGDATVSDLAARLDLPQPRVSAHLGVLRAAGLVAAQSSGRQRTYHADAERAGMLLAALAGAAPETAPRSVQATRHVQHNTPLRQARTCYDHLAGVAGVALLDELQQRGWLTAAAGGRPAYTLSEAGERALSGRGVDLTRVRASRRAFAAGCLDWTERRPHLAGALGAEVLRALERAGAVRRESGSRGVRLAADLRTWLDQAHSGE